MMKNIKSYKKAFTLIELIISILLIGLIVTYLFETLGVLKKSDKKLEAKREKRELMLKIKQSIYLDILQANDVNISKTNNKNIDLLTLKETKNSLHNLDMPDVIYLVDKKNRLIRVEGYNIKLPLNTQTLYTVKFDEVLDNIEFFKIYKSKKKDKILIYLKSQKLPEIFFEMFVD